MNIHTGDIVKTSFSAETSEVLTTYGLDKSSKSQVCLRTPINGKRYWCVSDLVIVGEEK